MPLYYKQSYKINLVKFKKGCDNKKRIYLSLRLLEYSGDKNEQRTKEKKIEKDNLKKKKVIWLKVRFFRDFTRPFKKVRKVN